MSEALQPFSEDPDENFRMENEFLKMKIAAQFGGDFGAMEGLPPDIENQFLKNILQFEDHTAHKPVAIKKVMDLLGHPVFEPSATITDAAIDAALHHVMECYHQHDLHVDFIADYPERLKYEFLTTELLEHETDTSFMMPGMTWNFIYEEFHPNHGHDIEEQANNFIHAWFKQDKPIFEQLLSPKLPLPTPGILLERSEVIKKMGHLFDSFTAFQHTNYIVGEVSYEMDQDLGMGFAEGAMKYDAIMENGESIHFEGPMKIYFALQGYYWEVMYFIVPGFEWG